MGWFKQTARAATLGLAVAALPALAQTETPPSAMTGLRFSQVNGGGGVPLNVVEKGDPTKPAIVFIHGYRQSYLSWIYQFQSSLADHCHLIAFDLRGHGNSGVPWRADGYTNERMWAEDVAAVIKATGAKQPLVVAWSFGGNVAMDFVRYHAAERLSGLWLVSTAAGMFAPPQPPKGAPPRPTATADLDANIAGVDSSNNFLFGKTVDPALVKKFTAAGMRTSPFVDRAIAQLGPKTNTDLVARLRAPVTLVFGGKDSVVAPPLAAKVAAVFPGSRAETYADAGHAPFLEDPVRFNAALDAAQCKVP